MRLRNVFATPLCAAIDHWRWKPAKQPMTGIQLIDIPPLVAGADIGRSGTVTAEIQ